jgi:hypothetical protein
MQEVKLNANYPIQLLSFQGYDIEVETKKKKKRVAIYIKSGISYKRKSDLEGKNNNRHYNRKNQSG